MVTKQETERAERVVNAIRDLFAGRGDREENMSVIEGAKSVELAIAQTLVTVDWAGSSFDRMRGALEAHLRVALTKEHVAAQDRMSTGASFLAAANLFLAIVALVGSCSG